MSRRGHNPLDDAEALLEGYGVPYRRRPSFRLQVEDLILDVQGTLTSTAPTRACRTLACMTCCG
jgi:hypothetical protein